MSNPKESPAAAQNLHPEGSNLSHADRQSIRPPDADVKSNLGNLTVDNPATIDPYADLLKINYDQYMMTHVLISREQELISRSQKLIMENMEQFDRVLTIIEKRLGIG